MSVPKEQKLSLSPAELKTLANFVGRCERYEEMASRVMRDVVISKPKRRWQFWR